jgi:tetratricopeptide (TPR) repeat protein
MAYFLESESELKSLDALKKQFRLHLNEAKNASANDKPRAAALAQDAVKLVSGNDDLLNEKGEALLFLASKIYVPQCNFSPAIACLQEALDAFENGHNRIGIAESFNNLGIIYSILTDHQTALMYFQQSVNLYDEVGDKKGFASSLKNFGIVCGELNDYDSALRYYQQSLETFEAIGEKKRRGRYALVYGYPLRIPKKLRDFAREAFSST